MKKGIVNLTPDNNETKNSRIMKPQILLDVFAE